ncbi:SAM-dependent methyltransferase [Streptomyces sp. NPDC051051]|uniref:SAM-dependent methyltransferase n=1 Tax=Streptomyces sp. NPDC051051 TaxID=3155666 RepID=UPI00343C6DB4
MTGIELADIRHPQGIVDHPGVPRVIDFDEPVALFLVAVPHFPTDAGGPARSSRHCATPCPPATARSVP